MPLIASIAFMIRLSEHLLQLDAIARHARQRPVELRPKNDVAAAQLVLREREDLEDLAG